MNKPLKPEQLTLMPDQGDGKPVNGAAVLAATGLTAEQTRTVEALIAAPGPSDDGFDWHGDDDCIVVKPVRGVAIYRNRADDVVVRSQGNDVDGDDFAFLRAETLPAVIAALKRELS